MASASNSTVCKIFKYDVFLSFRGEDTRKNFVDHLYSALEQKGIHTYKDDESIEKGKRISDELIKSIEDSRFHIIVFSKNYASSSWCLDELMKIMECRKMIEEKTVYPVFYDVKPSEVCKQSGAVGKAFAKRKNQETARKRREALKESSELAGWELQSFANGHEAKLIQQIVKEVSLELRTINSSAEIIEMEIGVKDNNETSLETEVNKDDDRMMGMIKWVFGPPTGATPYFNGVRLNPPQGRMMGMIKGLGDRAITNFTTTVVDQISIEFANKVSEASLSGFKSLQKLVLADVAVKSRHHF